MFGLSILGGLAAGIGGKFVNDWFNRRQERRTFADNERLSWQMWNANNQYNSPAAQMQRYREAGVNPNLIYSQMAMTPPPATVKSTGTPASGDVNWLLGQEMENSQLNNALAREEIQNKIQQRAINDVAMANTRAATELARNKIAMDRVAAADAHAESGLRRQAMGQMIDKERNSTELTDWLYDKLGGSNTGHDRGSTLRNSLSFVGGLAKQAALAYLSRGFSLSRKLLRK